MLVRTICALALLLALPLVATAEVAIGAAAPEIKGLKGTDGKEHGLDDVKKSKAVVVTFTCNGCPVAVAYQDRMVAFAKKYHAKGVELIALNTKGSEDVDAMKARAEEAGFCFTYADDSDAAVAKAYGAKVTPHFFVLDENRKVAYMGAFDDNMDDAKVTKHYVSDAVDALLAGKQPEVTTTKAVGCGISYK